MIDSHTHLYLPEFDNDRGEMIARAIDAGVQRFYLPGIDSGSYQSMIDLEDAYPAFCFSMMGLHPCSVNSSYEEELNIVESWILKRKFAAIGEIGLDFYWNKTNTNKQYEAFNLQIELALNNQLPIVIHSRDATKECIDVVSNYSSKGLKGIFHCFGGSYDQANQITKLGFLLGIGGVVTYKNSGLDKVIAEIPLESIVLETDAPYLTPQPFRGKRNESSYIKYVAQKIADIKSISIEEVSAITNKNALQLFKR